MRTELQKSDTIKSIGDALAYLDSAAKNKPSEVKDMIAKDIKHLRETLSDVAPEVSSALKKFGTQSVEVLKEARTKTLEVAADALKNVDESAHKNPWTYVGGAA